MWSQAVVDEAVRAIGRKRPAAVAAAQRRFATAGAFFDSAVVEGREHRMGGIALPDPDDRHVVAAALEGGCEAVVTFNLRDFPQRELRPLGLTAIDPDDYLCKLARLEPDAVKNAMELVVATKRNPPRTVDEEKRLLARCGLRAFAESLWPARREQGRISPSAGVRRR